MKGLLRSSLLLFSVGDTLADVICSVFGTKLTYCKSGFSCCHDNLYCCQNDLVVYVHEKPSLSGPAVAAIVISSIVALVVLIALIWYCCKQCNKTKTRVHRQEPTVVYVTDSGRILSQLECQDIKNGRHGGTAGQSYSNMPPPQYTEVDGRHGAVGQNAGSTSGLPPQYSEH